MNSEEHHKKNQEINATKTDVRDDVFTTTPTNAEVKSGTMLGQSFFRSMGLQWGSLSDMHLGDATGGKAELLGSNPGSIDKVRNF